MIAGSEEWIHGHVDVTGPIEVAHERSWATVMRVPTGDGPVWFKACAPVQAFEVPLSAELAARWPGRVAEVLAHDLERAWLLLADAGSRVADLGLDPQRWVDLLPAYAELQRGETAHAAAHLAHGVPDRRLERLLDQYAELVAYPLPLPAEEIEQLHRGTAALAALCDKLAAYGVPASIQHDDLHLWNVFTDGERLRVLDWGDSSVAHPFWSLVVPYRELDEHVGLPPDSPWFAHLRDAYLEPWGDDLAAACELAVRVGEVAHACAQIRQREHLPEADRPEFDRWFAVLLRRALAALE
jgi:hypothetical protein